MITPAVCVRAQLELQFTSCHLTWEEAVYSQKAGEDNSFLAHS